MSRGAYPHVFNNGESLTFSAVCTGTGSVLVEYPLKTGGAWTTGTPGADRVVYLRGPGKTPCGQFDLFSFFFIFGVIDSSLCCY